VSHISAAQRLPAYRVWQPYRGGGAFIALQALGWTGFAVSSLAQLTSVITPLERIPEGFLTTVASVAALTQGLLSWSHTRFEGQEKHGGISLKVSDWGGRLSHDIDELETALNELKALSDGSMNPALKDVLNALSREFRQQHVSLSPLVSSSSRKGT